MGAVIFSGSKVKSLKSTLSLNGGAEIISATVDPTVTATDGAIGSLLCNNTTGLQYRKLDSGSSTNWELVGSASGGEKNYAKGNDSTFDSALGSNWGLFDATAYPPTTYTGGTVTATLARTTSSPLQGSGSALFTPGGQYDSFAEIFTIDRADFARMMAIKVDYEIGTYASYTDGDLKLAIICASDSGFTTDVQVIQPAGHSILKVAGQETHIATFQSHVSNLYYKCAFIQTTASTGYTFKYDNFRVGPQSVAYGCPVNDPVEASSAIVNNFGTITVPKINYQRVGNFLIVEGEFRPGTPGSTASISLPTGAIDPQWYGTLGMSRVGEFEAVDSTASNVFFSQDGSTAAINGYMFFDGSDTSKVYFSLKATAVTFNKINASSIVSATSAVRFSFKVAIAGWSSSVLMSDSADTRVVAAHYYGSPPTGTLNASYNTASFATKVADTHAAFDGSTYTIKVPGVYDLSAQVRVSATFSAGNEVGIQFYKNNTTEFKTRVVKLYGAAGNVWADVTALGVPLVAGDTIKVRVATDGTTPSYASNADQNWFSIAMRSGPAQIAASETIAARYYGSTTATTPGSDSTCVYPTKDFDTHGGMNSGTGIYTVQSPGKYMVDCKMYLGSITPTSAGGVLFLSINKSGTDYYRAVRSAASTSAQTFQIETSGLLSLVAGDTIYCHITNTLGNTATGDGTQYSSFSIIRVGN